MAVPPASPLYFESALVAGPVDTVASAGDEPEPLAAVTVTVCGISALAGVKVRVVMDSTPAGLVVEIVRGTVTLAVGTDWSTTVNDDPPPPCITLGICAGAITIPSTGTMCRSPTETLPRTAPPVGVPRRSGISTAGEAWGSFRIGMTTVAVAEPAANVTVVFTGV